MLSNKTILVRLLQYSYFNNQIKNGKTETKSRLEMKLQVFYFTVFLKSSAKWDKIIVNTVLFYKEHNLILIFKTQQFLYYLF